MTQADLYIVHHPDRDTPIEETMEALNDLVRMGKVRYIGASNFRAWQFAKAQYTAQKHGWAQFISLENMHNIFKREDERELFPMLEDIGVSMTAYKVLSGGRLTRNKDENTIRSASQTLNDKEERMNARIEETAQKYNCSKADVMIAYELSKKPIDVVLVGTTKPGRMTDTVKALDVKLSPEDITYLESEI